MNLFNSAALHNQVSIQTIDFDRIAHQKYVNDTMN